MEISDGNMPFIQGSSKKSLQCSQSETSLVFIRSVISHKTQTQGLNDKCMFLLFSTIIQIMDEMMRVTSSDLKACLHVSDAVDL